MGQHWNPGTTEGLNQKSHWLPCSQSSTCPAPPFIVLEGQNKCTAWHCWSHPAGVSTQFWRRKRVKWGAEKKSYTGVWELGRYLSDAVLIEFNSYLPFCFSQCDFQGRPRNSLSYDKCDGGENKSSVWPGKSVGGIKLISLFYECVWTATICTACSTLGCLCIWDC